MATYIILSSVITVIVMFAAVIGSWRPNRIWFLSLIILLVLTAIFDSLIIYFEIVGYDTNKILGLYLGKAPIEDFLYTVVAAILAPLLWHSLQSNKDERGN